MRIPSSFFIRISGGRYTSFLTVMLLIVPALGTGIALMSKDTPLWVFQLLALLSGLGGATSHRRCRTSASSTRSASRAWPSA
ncbi:MAG: hypothetical protein M5U19_22475 [Microthrixaceae bacterium]|nr:hypothetical protein [Microthrixaceae bacterium]